MPDAWSHNKMLEGYTRKFQGNTVFFFFFLHIAIMAMALLAAPLLLSLITLYNVHMSINKVQAIFVGLNSNFFFVGRVHKSMT